MNRDRTLLPPRGGIRTTPWFCLKTGISAIAALTTTIVAPTVAAFDAPLPCKNTLACQTAVHPLSVCKTIDEHDFSNPEFIFDSNESTKYCTNPFAFGCFHSLDPEWDSQERRVCNSEDTAETISTGACQVPTDLQYMETRIFAYNWESANLETWLLQIILSEFLNVPTSVETGVPGTQMNFYHPFRAMDGGSTSDFPSLANAAEYGDCLSIPEPQRSPDATPHNNTGDETYQPCAHIAPEIWSAETARKMANDDGIIEAPQGLGVLGEEGWYIPKYTAVKDLTLLSYLGLQGPENQRKLANTFLRPTTWSDYCFQVSPNNCSEPDGVATRAPNDETEAGRYFTYNDDFTGHFRATEENDCDLFPENCTGHIADYPCGWSSSVTQQAHHLGIAVASNGPEGGARGYHYDSLLEIWHAANWTKSDVIIYWWSPDSLMDKFEGTDAAFMRISLPKPTQKCVEKRNSNNDDRCSFKEEIRWGDPEGSCDDPPTAIQKVVSKGLWTATHDPSIPEAIRSPSYQLAQLFTFDTLQLFEIFEYRKQLSDPRHAVCAWAIDNKKWIEGLLPPGYPRQIQVDNSTQGLRTTAIVMGSFATLLVIGTAAAIFKQRNTKVIKSAQVEFLALLLVGLLLIAIGAIVAAVTVSTSSCVATTWLLMVGYTIELVPLLVKISAINVLVHAAKGYKRVILQRKHLFTTDAVITLCVVIYLALWTALDPPIPTTGFVSGTNTQSTEERSFILETSVFCSSNRAFWKYVAIAWNGLLLISGSVLAFQSRKIELKDFNESHIVGLMLYSQCFFLIARILINTALREHISDSALSYAESIIFSVDVIITSFIYFLPKFKNVPTKRKSSILELMGTSIQESGNLREEPISASTVSEGHVGPFPSDSTALKCPYCGDSQTDTVRALYINQDGVTTVKGISSRMKYPSSEDASRGTPLRSSTVSNLEFDDDKERFYGSLTEKIEEGDHSLEKQPAANHTD
ncbi:7 transmembrane sweet-taste receptor of 3 GCPR-domain containing protein [Nitzschia inconspicua]|uniref:7 transmembrane sweet-taste receptor of 3 GCPR-domain containing protein n=1 Tax=Nitzschia inconspicua TaxID=303405 RepID=A0A9K3KK94_9STRA|nr:7 transmembrane sweet-taste receptor of 3 GCPR-domain containing protein [Nitzschia inconspicua]